MENKFIDNNNIQENYYESYNNLYEDESEENYNIDYYYENDENIKQWIVDWYKKEEEEGRF